MAYASKAYISGQDFAYNVIWESKLEKDVAYLSGNVCAGRLCGTAGNTEAEWLIIRRFRKAKLVPLGESFVHTFDVHVEMTNTLSDQKQQLKAPFTLVGHNIIGYLGANRKKPSDRYVIVMTHHDGHGTLDGTLYGGADSDASGVVAMYNLAEMLSTHKMITGETFSKNILFVSVDAHNYSLQGAYALFEDLKAGVMKNPDTGRPITLSNIDTVVNLDQIGSGFSPLTSGNPKYLIMLGNQSLPYQDRTVLEKCNSFYKTGLELGLTYYGSDQFTSVFTRLSDQRPFVDAGKSAVLFTSGITFRTNKSNDTAESLNYPVLIQRIRLIYRFIEKLVS